MRSSTSTGEAHSQGSSAVPVVWTGAAWTLLCTATVMLTSPSGEGAKGQGFQDSGAGEWQGLSHGLLFPQENRQGTTDLCRPFARHSGGGGGYEPLHF